jgi:undecaprenyl-diphosphatase
VTDSSDHTPARPIRPRTHGWRIDPRHALIAGALCWLGFAAVSAMVLTGRSEAFDTAGLELWRQRADLAMPRGPGWLIEAMRDVTALGGVLLRNLFALGAVVALLFLGLRREAILLAGTVMSGWAVGFALKTLFGRDRPEIVPHLMTVDGNSFPSGHSFNAAVVYIAMALAFAALSRRRSVRWTVIGCALAASLLIALSRVWLGVHYPSDAVAGWLGGAGWAFIALAVLYRPASAMSDESA